jgi:hypothetical protein
MAAYSAVRASADRVVAPSIAQAVLSKVIGPSLSTSCRCYARIPYTSERR